MKILVACGNGMGSSVILRLKVESVCEKMGIDAVVDNTSIGDAKGQASNYDLLLYPTAFEADLKEAPCKYKGGLINMVNEDDIQAAIEKALGLDKKEEEE